jgi:hypothetical protein
MDILLGMKREDEKRSEIEEMKPYEEGFKAYA